MTAKLGILRPSILSTHLAPDGRSGGDTTDSMEGPCHLQDRLHALRVCIAVAYATSVRGSNWWAQRAVREMHTRCVSVGNQTLLDLILL